MGVGNFAPIEGMGGRIAAIFTTAGEDIVTQVASNRSSALSPGTYRLAAATVPCRVRQGGALIDAVGTDAIVNVAEYEFIRVTSAADNYVAAIRDGGSDGVLNIVRVDP